MLCCSLKTQLWLFLRAVDSSVSIQSSHRQLRHCTLMLNSLTPRWLFWVVRLSGSHKHAWLPKLNLCMLSTLFHVPLLQISGQAPRPIHFSSWTSLESVLFCLSTEVPSLQVCLTLSDLLQFYLINFNRQLSAYKHLKLFHWWQWSSYNPKDHVSCIAFR